MLQYSTCNSNEIKWGALWPFPIPAKLSALSTLRVPDPEAIGNNKPHRGESRRCRPKQPASQK